MKTTDELDSILEHLTFEVIKWKYGASSAECAGERTKAKAAIRQWHINECKAAVREATQRCHDAMFPYEPDEPCPYCMCEAESIQHEALIECQEQLKQEGINPQGEGEL